MASKRRCPCCGQIIPQGEEYETATTRRRPGDRVIKGKVVITKRPRIEEDGRIDEDVKH